LNGVSVSVLGGRVFSDRAWAYLELRNDLERAVAVESVILGRRRSLPPGWRWERGGCLQTFPPGRARVDVAAALKGAQAAAPRPASVRRSSSPQACSSTGGLPASCSSRSPVRRSCRSKAIFAGV
jgi:hypothetical protein